MPETPGSPSTAYALQIPDDWDGQTWDCCPLFFPDSPKWRAIVRGLLQHLVRGRSWDETTGTITEVQETTRLMALAFDPSPGILNLPEVSFVSECMSRFADRLHEIFIIETLTASCCSNLIDDLPEESPVIPGIGDPPGEHEDWESYEAERCQIAQAIVDAFVDGAYQMSIHSTWGIAVLLAVIGVMFPVIRAAVALVAVLVPIAVQLWGSGTLEDFHSRILGYKEELVCALFTGGGYSATKQLFKETIDEGPFSLIEKAFMKAIVDYSDFNQLITGTADGDYASGYSPSYCDSCDEPPAPECYVRIFRGTPIGDDYYQSTVSGGSHFVELQIWTDSSLTEKSCAIVTVDNDSLYGMSFPAQTVYRAFNKAGTLIHNSNTVYPVNLCKSALTIKHEASFTVRVQYSTCCEDC